MKRLMAWVDRLVEHGVTASGNEGDRDRIRNVVWASLAILAIFGLAVVEGVRMKIPLFVVTALVAMLATAVAIGVVKRTGRYALATHLAIGILFTIMLVRITLLGGWKDPLIGVLYTLPIGAAILVDLRAGVTWGVASLVAIIGFWLVFVAGIGPSSSLPPGDVTHALFNRISIHIVILSMVAIFMLTHRSTESQLRDTNERLEREASHVEMLQIASVAANESGTVREAMERWLSEVCTLMDWPLAHAHQLSDIPGRPVSYLTDRLDASHARLAVEGARLARDVAIPASDQAVWYDGDLSRSNDRYYKTLADELGLRTRIAAVLDVGDEPWLIELFSEQPLEPDDRLAGVLSYTGTQLGRVLERERSQSRIHDLAYYDPLTKLPNRRHFREQLEERTPEGGFVVLLIGLDRFKTINDGLGHGAGDALLREMADRLIRATRQDTEVGREGVQVFRLGGDEFALILELEDPAETAGVAQRVLDRISRPFSDSDVELFATASIGIAVSGHDGGDASTLLTSADAALTSAKRDGGNRFRFFSAEMNAANRRRLVLENQLRRAVTRGELAVVYQPLISSETGRVVATEALVRWTTAAGEKVSPGEFIPIAEVTGQIEMIGAWVLRVACAQLAAWRQLGLDLRMSVNVSVDQLHDASFVEMVRGVMAANGLKSGDLELEITESRLVENVSAIVKTLERLRASGVRLALDDFGTGYSSLAQLKSLPIDRLKIDQSFIRNIAHDAGDSALVDAVLGIARDLDLVVVAEGVETEEQKALLCTRGCDELQGYLFSRPLDAESLEYIFHEDPSTANADLTPIPTVETGRHEAIRS